MRFCIFAVLFTLQTAGFQGVPIKGEEGNGCECKGKLCECCVFMDVPQIHLNETVCIKVKLLPVEKGIDLQMTLNGVAYIDEEVSLRNPPPLCVGVPELHHYASLCVALFNATWNPPYGACAKIEARLLEVFVKDYELGCFHFKQEEQTLEIRRRGLLKSVVRDTWLFVKQFMFGKISLPLALK